MGTFRIYAGLGGGFGGANFVQTLTNIDEESALEAAYSAACDIYEEYEGMLGINDWEDWRNEASGEIYSDDFDSDEEYKDALDEYAQQSRNDSMEGWIEYHVEEVIDEENYDEDEYEETYGSEE